MQLCLCLILPLNETMMLPLSLGASDPGEMDVAASDLATSTAALWQWPYLQKKRASFFPLRRQRCIA
jgi:hypothetical protein